MIIKEIIMYLIRALNPVAFRRDRAKQIQMLNQITKYLRISLKDGRGITKGNARQGKSRFHNENGRYNLKDD